MSEKKNKERIFLNENTKKGFKQFLMEVDGGEQALEKAKKNPDFPIYLVGIIQKGDFPNRNGRIYPFSILKKECDRYMNEEIKDGQSFGECFAEGHKIMTKDNGFVEFKDLTGEEEVATMNPDTKQFEWQKIIRKIEYDYEGDMIKFKNLSIDALVTPNHKFYVNYTDNSLKFERLTATELNTRHRIPRKCLWNGNGNEIVKIENKFGLIEIQTKIFSKLLAWYLAEGWSTSSSIIISQSKHDDVEEIDTLLKESGLDYSVSSRDRKKNIEYNFSIKNKILAHYCSQFGKSFDKYIPKEIKELNSEYIDLFLQVYANADGIRGNKYDTFYTVSKVMADDLIELCYKSNSSASITTKRQYKNFYTIENTETNEVEEITDFDWYTDKKYCLNKDQFNLLEKRREYKETDIFFVSRLSKEYICITDVVKETIQYSGKVYCVEVPNHVILINNGRTTYWSSNCDHPPESTVPELKNASHTIEDIWYKGVEVWGKIKLLNAYMPETASGKIARGIILNGKTLGISSRALGSVYQDQGGYDMVEDDLELICWDLVSRPSTHDANLKLAESKMKEIKNNMLTESQCLGGSCNINTSKKIIKNKRIETLTESEKVYLSILGVEKFLQIKNKH